LALGFWALVAVEQCCLGAHSHDIQVDDDKTRKDDGNGALNQDVEQGVGAASKNTDISTSTSSDADASKDTHALAEEADAEGLALHRRVIVNIRKTLGSSLGGLGTLIGMCLHAFPEAMAMGAQQDAGSMAVLILAVGFHKFSASFAVASSLRGICNGSQCAWWTLSMVFVAMGPLGMGVGALVADTLEGPALSALLMFAAGTLMAVGILEMLLPSFESKSWRRRNVLAAFRVHGHGNSCHLGLIQAAACLSRTLRTQEQKEFCERSLLLLWNISWEVPSFVDSAIHKSCLVQSACLNVDR